MDLFSSLIEMFDRNTVKYQTDLCQIMPKLIRKVKANFFPTNCEGNASSGRHSTALSSMSLPWILTN